MEFIPWKKEYALGIEVIDVQHMKLVGYISDLYNAVMSTDKEQKTKDVIEKLFQYTISHFSFEENVMKDAQFPNLEDHHKAHENFILELENYHQKFLDGKIVPAQLVIFLKDWLVKHIQGTDREYIPYFKAIGL